MADSTTDGKESQQVGEDAGSSNDAIVFDIGVVQPPDSPYSKDTENERAASLHLQEAIQVKEDTLPGCDDSDNSADIMTQETDKPDIQSVDVLSEGPGDPPEGKDHVQSPGGGPAFTGDAERIDLESHRQKIDETELDDSNQQDSVILKERSLEVKVKHGKAQQLEDGGTGVELSVGDGTKEMDMYNGLMPVESSLVIEPQEGKLSSEEKDVGLFSNNEIKEKCLNQKMPGLELVTEIETKRELGNASSEMEAEPSNEVEGDFVNPEQNVRPEADMKTASNIFLPDKNAVVGNESGTEEDQAAFMKELETFHKERCLEFKPPKFYGEPLNCLKLWRAVIRLGGYEQVTACKLWRQVGESFNPPKTCTTVSWTFRGFYEKALLEYEKHKMRSGELPFTDASFMEPSSNGNQAGLSQSSGSGRARRDAAARAMQGWHTQRLLGNGEVGDPIIKDKNSVSIPKREKQLKSVGLLKRRKLSPVDHPLQVARLKALKPQLRSSGPILLIFALVQKHMVLDSMVVDIGAPADWVKINVQRTKDCFEVYALVPGLLREEVRVQSDPAGRLVIFSSSHKLRNNFPVPINIKLEKTDARSC